MLADLNIDPLESDGEDHPPTLNPNPAIAAAVASAAPAVAIDSSTRSCNEEGGLAKNAVATKDPDTVECKDADQHNQGASVTREEKVSNLKAALVHAFYVGFDVPKAWSATEGTRPFTLKNCCRNLPGNISI